MRSHIYSRGESSLDSNYKFWISLVLVVPIHWNYFSCIVIHPCIVTETFLPSPILGLIRKLLTSQFHWSPSLVYLDTWLTTLLEEELFWWQREGITCLYDFILPNAMDWICVSYPHPNSSFEILTPSVIRVGPLEVMKVKSSGCDQCPRRRVQGASVLSPPCEPQQQDYNPGTKSTGTLILDFYLPELWDINFCCLSHIPVVFCYGSPSWPRHPTSPTPFC